MKKFLIYSAKVGIPVAIIGYLIWDAMNQGESAFTDERGNFVAQKVVDVLRYAATHWWFLLAAWAVGALAVILTLVRWYWLVRALDLPLRLKDALRIGFLGFLFNFSPLGIAGGDLLKAWLLAREQHGRRAEAVVTVMVDRVIGLYLLFVVASAAILVSGFWTVPDALPRWVSKITLLLTAISTVMIALVLLPDLSRGKTTNWIASVPKIGERLLRLVRAVQMYQKKLPALAAAALMSVGVHALFSVEIFLIVKGLYEQVPGLGIHFVLSPVSAATGVVPIVAGPYEWMLNELYVFAPLAAGGTMRPGQGLVVAFGYRLINVLIAAVAVVYYLQSRKEVAEVLHDVEQEAEPVELPSTTPAVSPR